MKKQEVLYNEDGAAPCKHCKRKKILVYPRVIEINGEDLYYAQCPNCKHWDIYEFLGSSKKNAIRRWNEAMLSKETIE